MSYFYSFFFPTFLIWFIFVIMTLQKLYYNLLVIALHIFKTASYKIKVWYKACYSFMKFNFVPNTLLHGIISIYF